MYHFSCCGAKDGKTSNRSGGSMAVCGLWIPNQVQASYVWACWV